MVCRAYKWSLKLPRSQPLSLQRPILTLIEAAGGWQISSFSWLLLLASNWHKLRVAFVSDTLLATGCCHMPAPCSVVCSNYTVATLAHAGITPWVGKRIPWRVLTYILALCGTPPPTPWCILWDKRREKALKMCDKSPKLLSFSTN